MIYLQLQVLEKIVLGLGRLKMAISEFGLSMLMLILLNHYLFIEVTKYLNDNKWFGSQ